MRDERRWDFEKTRKTKPTTRRVEWHVAGASDQLVMGGTGWKSNKVQKQSQLRDGENRQNKEL
jgi:hypothetical protein